MTIVDIVIVRSYLNIYMDIYCLFKYIQESPAALGKTCEYRYEQVFRLELKLESLNHLGLYIYTNKPVAS